MGRRRKIAVAAACCGLIVLAAVGGLRLAVGMAAVPPAPVASSVVLDRHGALMRAYTVADGIWRLPTTVDDVDPLVVRMLLAYEDHRFWQHHGVDVRAVARAAFQFMTHGRIVSGGSTLTMQVARLQGEGTTRSVAGKLGQMVGALALERHATKREILDRYLTLAPYGGNLEGLRAASLAYFGKEPRRLSVAEAALLVALPQAPEDRRPDRHPAAARAARDHVLVRALAEGVIDGAGAAAARRAPIPRQRRPFPMLAPQLADRVVAAASGRAAYRLTLDADLQRGLQALAAERAAAIDPAASAAIVVADHRTGAILASVGSAGFFDAARAGYIDMTDALRSPGSTLKPLIYGLGFELGLAHPESLVDDRPTAFAGYAPENYDRAFHGTVTVRQALQASLNVPAVIMLDLVGPARLAARMKRAGTHPVIPDLSPPGLAIGLGGLGVTLRDLTTLYAALARGGSAVTLYDTLPPPPGAGPLPQRRVLDERAAWYVSDILAGAPVPLNRLGGRIAFKTGTSYGHRDAWAVGYDGRIVVGVWLGRADSAPVAGLAGIDAAAPLLFDVFARAGRPAPLRQAPPGILRAATPALPPPLRRVEMRRVAAGSGDSPGPEIAFPPDGARVDLAMGGPDGGMLVVKVRNGTGPFTFFLDGAPVAEEPFLRQAAVRATGEGFATIAVVDGEGRSARVRVFVR